MSQGKRRHSRADSDRPQQRRDRRFDSAGLTFLLVLVIGGDRLRRERVKQTQLGWMSSKTGIWDDELSKSFWERMIRPLITMIVSVFKKRRARKNRSKKQQQNTRLDQDLRQAGITLTAGEFVIVRLMLTAMITFSSAIMARNVTRDLSLQLLILLFALTIAVTLPVLYLRSRVRGRQLAIQNQTPNVTELQTFATAIVQSEQYGTPMKNVLRQQAVQLRTARRQAAQEKGMKAPVRILLPMILLIFPVIFIILLGPTIITAMAELGS